MERGNRLLTITFLSGSYTTRACSGGRGGAGVDEVHRGVFLVETGSSFGIGHDDLLVDCGRRRPAIICDFLPVKLIGTKSQII